MQHHIHTTYMAFQLLHFFTIHQTPNSNCFILSTTTSYLLTIWAKCNTTNPHPLVAFQLLHFFTIHQTPNSNCFIFTTTSYLLTIWAKCNYYILPTNCVTFQLLHFFTIHQTPNSNCTISVYHHLATYLPSGLNATLLTPYSTVWPSNFYTSLPSIKLQILTVLSYTTTSYLLTIWAK